MLRVCKHFCVFATFFNINKQFQRLPNVLHVNVLLVALGHGATTTEVGPQWLLTQMVNAVPELNAEISLRTDGDTSIHNAPTNITTKTSANTLGRRRTGNNDN